MRPRPLFAATYVALALAALSAAPAPAAEKAAAKAAAKPGEKPPGCEGTISGDAKGKFDCTAIIGTMRDGQLVFAISVPAAIEGFPSLVPGAFVLPGKAEPRSFSLDELGAGKAAVAVEKGLLYTATKTTGQRGEVALTLRSVERKLDIPGAYAVHGTYRARLLPAGGGRTGEVVVDVKF